MELNIAIETLKLFNEKADKLENLSFTKGLGDTGLRITYNQNQPIQVERYGPNDESIDAFVLTIRFFIQDNEPTSLRNLSKLFSVLPISSELVEKLDNARTETNLGLSQATSLSLDEVDLTFRSIFDVFLWGGLAHANPKLKTTYDGWSEDPAFFLLLQDKFIHALRIILNMIFFARAVNKAALSQLNQG